MRRRSVRMFLIAACIMPASLANASLIGDNIFGSFWMAGNEGSNFFSSGQAVVGSGWEFHGTGPDPLADYSVKADFDESCLTFSMIDLRTGPEVYTTPGMSGGYSFKFWGFDFQGPQPLRVLGVEVETFYPGGVWGNGCGPRPGQPFLPRSGTGIGGRDSFIRQVSIHPWRGPRSRTSHNFLGGDFGPHPHCPKGEEDLIHP